MLHLLPPISLLLVQDFRTTWALETIYNNSRIFREKGVRGSNSLLGVLGEEPIPEGFEELKDSQGSRGSSPRAFSFQV